MSPFRSNRNAARAIALVTTAALLLGCQSWRTRPLDPAEFAPGQAPRLVRITTTDGKTYYVDNPIVIGDSLIAHRRGVRESEARFAVMLDQVRQVAVLRVDAGKTIAMITGVGALVIVAAAIAAGSSDWGWSGGGSSGGSGSCDACYSCPLIYSWDGHDWRLDSGTFGGAIAEALARTDVDNLMFARPVDGRLRLRLVNELNETDNVDALRVLAVDHDPGVSVAPDGAGGLHSFGTVIEPIRATDYRGTDVLARVRAVDGWNWESVPTGRDTSRAADLRDGVVLTFERPHGSSAARLVLDANNTPWAAAMLGQVVQAHGAGTAAWYDSLNRSPALARGLGARLAQEAFLSVAVETQTGWRPQGLVWEAGPEVIKRQIMRLDLSGVTGDTVRVRLDAPVAFWSIDRVAIDYGAERPLRVTELRADSAVTFTGADVRALLDSIDGGTFRMETGDGAIVSFVVPAPTAGQARSYLVRSSGWYRIHTSAAGAADEALLAHVATEPGAISRFSVAQLNVALARLQARSR